MTPTELMQIAKQHTYAVDGSLYTFCGDDVIEMMQEAIAAAQLAAPVAAQEPVAWMVEIPSAVEGWHSRNVVFDPPTGASKPGTVITALYVASQPAQSCICGEPDTKGTVHRTDGPCYQASQPAQEPVKLTDCRHCGFKVALGMKPQPIDWTQEQPAQGERQPEPILPGQVKNWSACAVCYGSGTDVAGNPCRVPACRLNRA